MSEVRMNIKDKLKNNNLGKIKNNLKRKEWTEDDLYEFLIGNILNNSKKSIYDLWYADNYFLEQSINQNTVLKFLISLMKKDSLKIKK